METVDCFALKGKKCTVLAYDICKGRCSFYRTLAEVEAGRAAAFRRIASLPLAVEYKISFDYYGGTMPWHPGVRRP